MRVLFLVRTLTAGGVETHIMTLGRGLMAQGCEVAIASDGGIDNHTHGIQWFEASGFRHYKIDFPRPADSWQIPLRSSKSLVDLEGAVRRFRPDLVHVHYRATSGFAAAMQLLHGVPFVSTLHMTGIPSGALHRMASFWGQLVIAISAEVQDYLKNAFRVNEARIRLVHNGADEKFFRQPSLAEKLAARAQLNLPVDAKVIAMVARMSREKGHDVLLDAMAKLHTEGQKVVALLAGVSIEGDTSWRDEIQRRAERMGLSDYIRILGFMDARTVLWASDASVLPSRQEGFPMAVVESMLCGLAPIRTPAAGARDQIRDGEDGFIIPFDDSAMLSRKLTLVLNTELGSTMGSAAIQKARGCFSAGSMVTKTMSVYREALDLKGASKKDSL
ncbi:MAG TPA: glycosyltransferase family 4 protein [Bryobacteraceae bacterium]